MLSGFFGYSMWSGMPNSQLSMIVNKKSEAQAENIHLLMVEFNYWSNLAVSRLKWSGLPDSIDERLLNMGLYFSGNVAFFEHEDLGLIALPSNAGNRFNLLYQPITVTASGYNQTFNLSNANTSDKHTFELVRYTPSGMPLAVAVMSLVVRMTDVLRAIDVIVQRHKRPYVILCEEKERMTIQNAIKRVKDNEDLILALKDYGLGDRAIQIAPTPAIADFNSLWETYKRYETKLYTLLGIDNKDGEKKERLVVDEVNANNMVIQMSDTVSLKELTLCLENVNRTFGTNISVDIENKAMYEEIDDTPNDYFRFGEQVVDA